MSDQSTPTRRTWIPEDVEREFARIHNYAMDAHEHMAVRLLQHAYAALECAVAHADPGTIPVAPSVHRFTNSRDAIEAILHRHGYDPWGPLDEEARLRTCGHHAGR